MNRFFVLATEFNVLNHVAVLAGADRNALIYLVQDPLAQSRGFGERLQRVLGQRRYTVNLLTLDDASVASFQACVAQAVQPLQTGTDFVLAIGGRKRDSIVLLEVVRKQALAQQRSLTVVTVAERPAGIELLALDGAQGLHATIFSLNNLDAVRTIDLDEILALNGYERTPTLPGVRCYFGKRLPNLKIPIDQAKAGDALELHALRLVHQHLGEAQRAQVAQLWFGVEIRVCGSTTVGPEFDILLVLRDGRGIHFECKSGYSGGAKGLQAKVFQLRSAMTPHSGLVICRQYPSAVAATRGTQAMARQYGHLGKFGVFNAQANGVAQGLEQAFKKAS